MKIKGIIAGSKTAYDVECKGEEVEIDISSEELASQITERQLSELIILHARIMYEARNPQTMKDIPPEYADIINKHFWELIAKIEKSTCDCHILRDRAIKENAELKKLHENVITFEKSALPELCKLMNVPYDKDIIGFTKKGPVKNIFDLIEQTESKKFMCEHEKNNTLSSDCIWCEFTVLETRVKNLEERFKNK